MSIKGRVTLDNLQEQIEELEERVDRVTQNLVNCDVCKCLLREHQATKGKGEIRQGGQCFINNIPQKREEFIYYPYYCKSHEPILEEEKE